MRIIAGEFRGRRLLPPAGDQTRPVTDRVKQSVFDIVSPFLPDARVYDCFAGTGSFGLEALSRGASHVTFFESHRQTLALLKRNIDTLGVGSRTQIVSTDCFVHLSRVTPADRADIVFLDPPYIYLKSRSADLQAAAKALVNQHLSPTSQVYFRHDVADALSLEALPMKEVRAYGSMVVEILASA